MAQLISDRRDIDFNLYEMFDVQELLQFEAFKDFDKKTFDMIINEARNLAIKELLPTYEDGDKTGVSYNGDGTVTTPDSFKKAHKLYVENEWTAPIASEEWGGQGLPATISGAAKEYFSGANWSIMAYGSMGAGTGGMIENFGTQEQKETYIRNLYSGKWGGTMLLTESDAGSELGRLTTSAKKNDDGTYTLTGTKIFITCGEHDLVDQIIHPVLARVEGAPEGTKGISIFIVPKYLVNKDGSLGERNDIVCTNCEHKHGLHGNGTCTMSMGSKGKCTGYLLGEENRGMKIMFRMMNGARMGTALQAQAYASTCYLYALNYARERIQGKDLSDFTGPSVPIIQHPDVRRNLITMKSYVDGMRSLIYYLFKNIDLAKASKDQAQKTRATGMVELLTPIVKGYCSEVGYDVCVQAMQIYGGAGYCQDYPVEALTRDCKIVSIYEGTTGIQSMDLVARKIPMENGDLFRAYIGEMKQTIAKAKEITQLYDLAQKLDGAVDGLAGLTKKLLSTIMSQDIKTGFAHSVPFLHIMGDVTLGWMMLWRAVTAKEKLEKAGKKDKSFYEGQLHTANFFISSLLPVTLGKINSVEAMCDAAVTMDDAAFGGL
ncbi:MAG: acyl-CoA dehydrogenase [Desulfobacteraceae bacterium]|nr:acyl-CoA dehydrogenase [Desulfobacteraceae bacterium]